MILNAEVSDIALHPTVITDRYLESFRQQKCNNS